MAIEFDRRQFVKACDRLTKAKEALQKCRNADSFSEFTSHWADLVTDGGAVLHAVEAGSKHSPQGRQWYGSVRRLGRADPLLFYMYQSRNEEEHGSNPTTNAVHFPVGWQHDDTGEIENVLSARPFEPGMKRRLIFGNVPGGVVMLSPVIDTRHNLTTQPPMEHDGKPLQSNHPIDVGELYIAYLERLLRAIAEQG